MARTPGVCISGPLTPFIDGVWSYLLAQGYSPLSGRNMLRLVSHLSRWLVAADLGLSDLSHEHVETFFSERRKIGYISYLTPRSLRPILQYLESEGVLNLPRKVVPRSATDHFLDEYERFLVEERGLKTTTVRNFYRRHARKFLSYRFGSNSLDFSGLTPNDITTYILQTSQTSGVVNTKHSVSVTRSLLRFLHLRGDLQRDLSSAVPAVAGSRQAGIPKFISSRELRKLLESCDRRTHIGRRDFAILLLLARLGLRSCEVAALELNSVDWRAGELCLHGKGRINGRLPLPDDVGQAIAGYLKRGRPSRFTVSRSLFLTSRAPYRALSAGCVTGIVARVSIRAGLRRISGHRLRHTAATQMLRQGASLTEVALVLRHRSIDTTAIYAKVDHGTLRQLAFPWPGGEA
jgi:site-specific recombinase XerD